MTWSSLINYIDQVRNWSECAWWDDCVQVTWHLLVIIGESTTTAIWWQTDATIGMLTRGGALCTQHTTYATITDSVPSSMLVCRQWSIRGDTVVEDMMPVHRDVAGRCFRQSLGPAVAVPSSGRTPNVSRIRVENCCWCPWIVFYYRSLPATIIKPCSIPPWSIGGRAPPSGDVSVYVIA